MRGRDAVDVREIWLRLGEALAYLFAYAAVLVVDVIGIGECVFGNARRGAVAVGAAFVAGGLLIRIEPKERTRPHEGP